MTFRPGDMTIVDVETTLFPRVKLEHVGLGGMASTYLFGPNDRRNFDDIRPAVYESSGLQMLNGQGEWIWRPLHNPETLQISAFVDQLPKGFGLLAARPRPTRPSRTTTSASSAARASGSSRSATGARAASSSSKFRRDAEINDNILAYWRPKAADGGRLARSPFAYRQYWCW